MSKGWVVFLNGASSSGKSSIAEALQAMVDEPCMHLCIDDYLGAFQRGLWKKQEIMKREWPHIIRGFHAAGAAVARAGNSVIIDDVLEDDPPWVDSVLEVLDGLEVTFVGVHCPLGELERREGLRPERREGMASLQFEPVHAQAEYDVEVDTSVLSPSECAERILEWMRGGHGSLAFERLREERLDAGG
jgi:chloramphenicol 3-O phosphotransferase